MNFVDSLNGLGLWINRCFIHEQAFNFSKLTEVVLWGLRKGLDIPSFANDSFMPNRRADDE